MQVLYVKMYNEIDEMKCKQLFTFLYWANKHIEFTVKFYRNLGLVPSDQAERL